MRRIMAIGAALALVATFVIYGLVGSASAVTSGALQRGAIGGDFDTQLPAGSLNGADWGTDQSLHPSASNLIHDGNVFIVVSGWQDAGGQTAPTTTDGPGLCTGTISNPTAPAGDVCIYVTGSDNAVNLAGDSVAFGSGGSRFGFKLLWDSAHNGDTYVDAVWAYRYP